MIQQDEFVDLVEGYRHEFHRYVRRMTWDGGAADDVFASAVLAAFENRHKFTPGTNFRAWMYRILTNKCYVANRETKRAFASLDDAESEFPSPEKDREYGDVLRDPSAFLEACGEEVHGAMGRLSAAERSCILLRAAEKFSYKEIAEILDMPVGTVMTHLARGRAKLRRDLLAYARERGLVRATSRTARPEIPADTDGTAHEAFG